MNTFVKQLQLYREAVEADITTYAKHTKKSTRERFGEHPAVVTDAFFDMLERGGKRVRGALVIAGYEMCGGTDREMIVRAATAIEMVHAHLLIIDDIQDRSATRRGKPTVHEMLKSYHTQQQSAVDAAHTGISLALNAAWTGGHAAYRIIAGLNVAPELRSNAAGIIADAIVTTAHGQTIDFLQELTGVADIESVENVMQWKTAYYTMLNPLCVGMVLAGAGCEDTDAIREYALHAGMAFQITDDIIGVFGTNAQTGKDSMDDLREGKRTLLTVYTFTHASPKEQDLLHRCLGNPQLTSADFEACKDIMRSCGALQYAEAQVDRHIAAAHASLDKAPARWGSAQTAFLRELAQSFAHRSN